MEFASLKEAYPLTCMRIEYREGGRRWGREGVKTFGTTAKGAFLGSHPWGISSSDQLLTRTVLLALPHFYLTRLFSFRTVSLKVNISRIKQRFINGCAGSLLSQYLL